MLSSNRVWYQVFVIALSDRYVIVGNHRDSLAYGGVEPGTGSACLMELARVLGQLKEQGIATLPMLNKSDSTAFESL